MISHCSEEREEEEEDDCGSLKKGEFNRQVENLLCRVWEFHPGTT
jgi:hypothetical protein